MGWHDETEEEPTLWTSEALESQHSLSESLCDTADLGLNHWQRKRVTLDRKMERLRACASA